MIVMILMALILDRSNTFYKLRTESQAKEAANVNQASGA
jgi:hypothetical protein